VELAHHLGDEDLDELRRSFSGGGIISTRSPGTVTGIVSWGSGCAVSRTALGLEFLYVHVFSVIQMGFAFVL
jgi:hypothetical protein